MDITRLQEHIPAAIYSQIPGILHFGIDGSKRLSHLLGQCAHESGNWKSFTENLNYSAQGLANTWPTRYSVNSKASVKVPNDLAKRLQRNPQAIANNCYANRNGNGNEASGDGWKHRGMGALQTTGKSNQQEFFTAMGLPIDSDPLLIATDYILASAAFFFRKKGLWTICDKGVDVPTITAVTKVVNGGTNGLEERIHYTQDYYKILTT